MRFDVPAIAPLPYASTITPQERRAGFVVVQISLPPYHAIVLCVDNQRMAVKVTSPTGGVSYAIVDRDSLKPLDACVTLGELLTKYPAIN